MYTNSEECVYEKSILINMLRAGLKLKKNGKTVTLKSLKEGSE